MNEKTIILRDGRFFYEGKSLYLINMPKWKGRKTFRDKSPNHNPLKQKYLSKL